ncbi:unnamed protein product, partial [Mesorhabditis belari]|uniref:SEC14-like protein 1 n=1 Tax=Mesorhabditis belari TaxID=2138241 RepID=A0AAF3EGZ9_9BILA
MVQTYQSPVRIYKHPFEIVMAAYEKRFPTCPQIPIFVGSEIVYDFKSDDGAVEVVERKCQLNVEAPYLVKKVAGVDYVYFMQKNSLDRRKRTLFIEATNISFSQRIVVKEDCNYYVHPENNEWTCFEQSASLDVKHFFGFESAVEKLAVKQYAANLAKGKEILECFIEDLLNSGVTYIPPFTDSQENGHKESNGDSISIGDSAIDVSKEKDEDEGQITLRRGSRADVLKKARSTSIDDPEAKLEAEYIRRFLGQLSPLEESRLCELKYGLQASHKGKLPNDAHLLRFLRARDFDVLKAKEMVLNSLLWRKQHGVDKILQDWQRPAIMQQFFAGAWHHQDKKGRPLFVLRLGALDMKGLLRACGLEAIVKLTLSICEEGLEKTAQATKNLGVPISSWTLVVDLEGLSMRHLWRPGVQCLLRIIEIVEAHYPETLGQVLVVRAPRVFPVLWTLISPFIDENTRKKFMINSGENMTSEIMKYVDEQYIPDFLGGVALVDCGNGGHVPKNLYQPVDYEAKDEGDVLSSTYTKGTLSKGSPIEVCVPVSSSGCVLTWDFDVIKSDCEFLVYHTSKIITEPAQPHSPTVLHPVDMITAAIENAPPPAVCSDPSLRLGPDLTIVENPVTFNEGDSMQGSHYCSKSGTYILQWRIPQVPIEHNSSFDFSLSGPKCKLMYYHEVLDSADFRGSVASLESCRSSFSSIAPPHSAPPTPATKRAE